MFCGLKRKSCQIPEEKKIQLEAKPCLARTACGHGPSTGTCQAWTPGVCVMIRAWRGGGSLALRRDTWPGRGPCSCCRSWGPAVSVGVLGGRQEPWGQRLLETGALTLLGKLDCPLCGGQFRKSLPRRERPDWRPEQIFILGVLG